MPPFPSNLTRECPPLVSQAARRLGPTPEQLKALDEDIAALRAREADEQAALPDE